MAEREIYDPTTGQYVLIDDQTGDPVDRSGGTSQPTGRSGPPYTLSNLPPPPADPGWQWILNPETGEFEYRNNAIGDQVGGTPPVKGATSDETTNMTGRGIGGPLGNTLPTTYGGGYGGGYGGSGYDMSLLDWPNYNMPEYLDPGAFDPGPAFSYADFSYKDFAAPTEQDMLNEPGFQFRLDQGRKALEASAAGRGKLRSGGTLKDILGYGQNFASQEYNNVYNRALQQYDTNRANAFGNYQSGRQNAWDNWQTGYMGRKDAYSFLADNYGRRNTFNQNNAMNDYTSRKDRVQSSLDDAFRRWAKTGDWLAADAG